MSQGHVFFVYQRTDAGFGFGNSIVRLYKVDSLKWVGANLILDLLLRGRVVGKVSSRILLSKTVILSF